MVSCLALILGIFIFQAPAVAKGPGKKAVPWLSPEEAQARLLLAEKPLLIDVYTSWCQYCKLMDASIWRHDSVVAYVAEHFIPIKFDAETKTAVQWQGTAYQYQPRFKVHQLAVHWLAGNMVYPSTVWQSPGGQAQIVPGALPLREVEALLKYHGSGSAKRQSFEAFRQTFSATW